MGKYAKRIPKERTIYSNYDLWEKYPDKEIIEMLIENGNEEEDITDNMIMEERYFYDECDWDNAKHELEKFFKNGNKWLLVGSVGRWDGVYKAGTVFETFDDFFYRA